MKRKKEVEATGTAHRDFLWMAYCGLVLRGYDRERDIPDPILRKVWRFGKKIMQQTRPGKVRGVSL